MAKNKPDPKSPKDDQPRRAGDQTEFDFSLQQQDEQLAKGEGEDFDLLSPSPEGQRRIDGTGGKDGSQAGDATYSDIDLGDASVSASASSSSLFGTTPKTPPPPTTASASSSNLFGTVKTPPPAAKPFESGVDLGTPAYPVAPGSDIDLPAVSGAFESGIDLEAPAAAPVLPGSDIDLPAVSEAFESGIDLETPAAVAVPPGSDVDLPIADAVDSAVNLEPIVPVQPASGWFEDAEPEAPNAVSTDAIEEAMTAPTSGIIDGSDIFAGPVPTALPKSDVSDVIAATAYRPAKPVEGERKTPSVAMKLERPPESSHDGDVRPDSLFDIDESDLRKDDADLGATPLATIDASSIMADFSEPGSSHDDSSAIRLEAPGVEATIKPETGPGKGTFSRSSTELELDLPEALQTNEADYGDSDLFGTKPEFELTPDMGKIDPFGDTLETDQPSLSTAPSSIFSGAKPPASGSGSSIPVANPDSSADSVEFSDHPDPNSADSGSFHVLPAGAGAVDMDLPATLDDPHPERSMMAQIPEDDDWSNAKTDPGPNGSGVRLGNRLDPTDEMAPLPAAPLKGKAKAADKPKVVAWADNPEEEEKASPKKKQREPEPTSRRGLAGLALGLLLGVGASAGTYFSGAIPNGSGAGGETKTVVQADPEIQKKLDAASGELKNTKTALDAAEKAAADAKGNLAKAMDDARTAIKERDGFAADLKTEKEKTLQAIKDGAADKEKAVALGKDLTAEKEKTTKAEKDLLAEKDKIGKLEKDVLAEKDKVVKAEKDLLAEKDKVVKAEKDLIKAAVDSKKAVDAVKADLTKATDSLKAETTERARLADTVKARQSIVDAIAKELQAGKLLGEKFDDAALIAAAKSSVSRATGPDLSKLIPADLSAVAGTGLSTGHVLDLANRTNKADAASKAAAGEVAKLKTDHTAELKAMVDANKKAVGDLKDAHAADLKKATDANTVAMDKLKVELKTAKDGTAAEVKKATDAAAVAMEKVKVELKTAKDETAAEVKKATEAAAVSIEKLKVEVKTAKDGTAAEVKKATDAAAVAMDKLKTDSDAKLKAAADKAATDAKAASDANAKQVASLENAVLTEKAKTAEAERRFKALGGAATLASQELDRVATVTAARNRDLGIAAYKAGRYPQAIAALDEAAKHDPNDALAWYFLGATKWAQGKVEDAKADYKKGAERESLRLIPARDVDAMIGSIQGPARDALGAARP